jgi:DNA polymerase-3 subunit alpha
LSYCSLHLHTHYSTLDGVGTPEEYVERAHKLGMSAMAITDHGVLSGHRSFYKAAKEKGIKPILGIEAYITQDRFDKRGKVERTTPLDKIYNHLTIIAKNQTGLENINKLNEIAWTEGFFSKPRIDYEILEKYKEGLIVTSGCISAPIPSAINLQEYAVAKNLMGWFKERFDDDFYIEIMPHNDKRVNQELLDLADTFGIKPLVTSDAHHVDKDQRTIQELMLILNTHANILKDATYEGSVKYKEVMDKLNYLYGKDRKMSFQDFDIYVLSQEEMEESMKKQNIDRKDIYENTIEVANKVEEYDIKFNLDLLPVKHTSPNEELRELVLEGLKNRGLLEKEKYMERIEEELGIIKEKNFSSYFLVVRNIIAWAKSQDIMVGPGRGSSAGSLVCYALGITEIDPLKYNLLFSRFINAERNDLPDIDTDIADNKRERVRSYIESEYKNVASIATFQQFRGKGIVRDVSRALNVPLSDVNKVLKVCDTWESFCTAKNTQWFRAKYPDVEVYGEKLRGRIRGTGVHAAGIVTSKEPIFKYAPMETRASSNNKKERIPVVAVDMEEAAEIGLIKIDALGLKTLSVISDAIDSIKERKGKKIDLTKISLDDKEVYDMLSDGLTKGVFQCEATPYTNLLVKMRVSNFNELVASNALVRPGAMNTIGKDYIERKRGKQTIEFIHPILKEETEETYGCILYQEQVMSACMKMGNMSASEADKVRKIIGKKRDAAEFDIFKDKFVKNATEFIGIANAENLWKDFEAHSGYSFNKSHAVAYSMLSYWTAWLKKYYPLEFMFALLKNEKDKDARTEYLIEAKRMKIAIKLPHINESEIDFSLKGSSIRFGLSSIKFLSDKLSARFIEARPFDSYASVEKFVFTKGNGVNSRALSSLDAVGALTFPDNPLDEKRVKANLYEYLNLPEFKNPIPSNFLPYIDNIEDYEEGNTCILMGMVKKIKRGNGWVRIEIMDKTGMVGIFDSEDSTIETGKTYLILVSNKSICNAILVDDIANNKDSTLIKYLAFKEMPCLQNEYFVVSFKPRITKAGKKMATMVVSNNKKELSGILVFPKKFADGYMRCEPGVSKPMIFEKMSDGAMALKEVS